MLNARFELIKNRYVSKTLKKCSMKKPGTAMKCFKKTPIVLIVGVGKDDFYKILSILITFRHYF